MFYLKQSDIGEPEGVSIGGIPLSTPKGHRPGAFRRYQPSRLQPYYGIPWQYVLFVIPCVFGLLITLKAGV